MTTTDIIDADGIKAMGTIVMCPGGEGHPNMIIIKCHKGYIMCGYLSLEAAEKFGDAAAVISGKNFDEILDNPVKAVTPAAMSIGVTVGMKGRQVIKLLSI